MKSYTYPDKYDHITGKFIVELEKTADYWEQSENAIIKLIKEHISTYAVNNKKNFLDAGCGPGRLIPKFEPLFDHIVAVEPDPLRIANAAEVVEKLGIGNKITFYTLPAESYNSQERFDFILCSHVIQHIHSFTVKPLLLNLRNHLKDNGILAITTCHSIKKTDNYRKNYLLKGKPASEEIDEETFNHLVSGKNLLPIHFFSTEAFMKMLRKIGFDILAYRVFHIDKADREQMHIENIDDFVNITKRRQNHHGVDMCIIVKKL
jgi:2-polyprenyl-3-methyl-5-hydroxy-6-metoxy-1,4-benzoquinol methylase